MYVQCCVAIICSCGSHPLLVMANITAALARSCLHSMLQVWESDQVPGLKHRVKDSFVQWQHKATDGIPVTFGLRLKSAVLAQQVLTVSLASLSFSLSLSLSV